MLNASSTVTGGREGAMTSESKTSTITSCMPNYGTTTSMSTRYALTKSFIMSECVRQGYYRTPQCNEKLHLHFKGFNTIEEEAMDDYTIVNVLWLEGNCFDDFPIRINRDVVYKQSDYSDNNNDVSHCNNNESNDNNVNDGMDVQDLAPVNTITNSAITSSFKLISPFQSQHSTLKQLYLHQNMFRQFPAVLSLFNVLDTINLSDNFIDKIEYCVSHRVLKVLWEKSSAWTHNAVGDINTSDDVLYNTITDPMLPWPYKVQLLWNRVIEKLLSSCPSSALGEDTYVNNCTDKRNTAVTGETSESSPAVPGVMGEIEKTTDGHSIDLGPFHAAVKFALWLRDAVPNTPHPDCNCEKTDKIDIEVKNDVKNEEHNANINYDSVSIHNDNSVDGSKCAGDIGASLTENDSDKCNNVDFREAGVNTKGEIQSTALNIHTVLPPDTVDHITDTVTWIQLKNNHLTHCKDLLQLLLFKRLSSLDLSSNRIGMTSASSVGYPLCSDDSIGGQEILIILENLPELKSLILSGNPCVRQIPFYRKRVIATCQKLVYLDDRPVFSDERRLVNAWAVGGVDGEKNERQVIRDEQEMMTKLRLADFRRMMRAGRGDDNEDDLTNDEEDVSSCDCSDSDIAVAENINSDSQKQALSACSHIRDNKNINYDIYSRHTDPNSEDSFNANNTRMSTLITESARVSRYGSGIVILGDDDE
eukprot:Tbor_TRINITY_DN5926_c0_g1::TRINITY_DN5926_c0_g1_i4::g.18997::m.18997